MSEESQTGSFSNYTLALNSNHLHSYTGPWLILFNISLHILPGWGLGKHELNRAGKYDFFWTTAPRNLSVSIKRSWEQ